MQQILAEHKLEFENICFIGDDLTDMPVMAKVGLAVAVADAADEVRKTAHHKTKLTGGRGAVRELVELILKSQNRWQEVIQRYTST